MRSILLLILLCIVVVGIICKGAKKDKINKVPKAKEKDLNNNTEENKSTKSSEIFDVTIPKNTPNSFLLKPLNSKLPGTIYFRSNSVLTAGSEAEQSKRIDTKKILDWNDENLKKFPVLYYYIHKKVPLVLEEPMKNNGLIRTKLISEANVIYDMGHGAAEIIKNLNKYQRYNHFPTTWNIGRKDSLLLNFRSMKEKFPLDFNYLPEAFVLPNEKLRFLKKIDEDPKAMWLIKPRASSRGRGISLMTNKESLPDTGLISRYIANPHLINNKKYDIRLYVLVTGYTPLKIYLFPEGLIRFASEEYNTDKDNMENLLIHLTNFSINKNSGKFENDEINTNDECKGSKWSIGALKRHFKNNNLKFEDIWVKIKDIIAKTIISIADKTIDAVKNLTKHRNNLYELYGFDVLIDENLRPWLLEVNVGASLGSSTPLDLKIKSALIASIFNTIGIVPYSHVEMEGDDPKLLFGEERPNCIQKNVSDSEEMQCNANNKTSDSSSSDSSSDIVNYSLEEFSRSGLFQRVFPLKSNIDYYSKFIEKPGEENTILWDYIKNSEQDL